MSITGAASEPPCGEEAMGEISRITQKTENRFLNFFELDTVKKTGQPGKY